MASAAAATLPWQWAIEALADLKADTSLLKALITRVPNFLDEAPEPVRERVTLRYLEECLDSAGGDGGGEGAPPGTCAAVPSDSGSGCGIDVGLSSEEVLCRHWREVATLGNLEKDRAELLKHDLRHFVLQKRAALPKSSLELLKESIMEGCRHPVSFLKEHSGLDGSDQVDNPQLNSAEDHVSAKRLRISTDDGRIQSVNSASVDLASDNGHVLFQGSLGPGLHLQKPNISDADREHYMCADTVGTGGSDIQLLKQSLDSQQPSKGESHVQHAALNGSQKHVNSPFCQRGSTGELSVMLERPSDDDGDHNLSPNIDPNIEIIAAEKQQLLSSQNPVNDDSMMGEFTEQGLCIKCNKGGQLLTCSSSSCLIAVHESCLGSVVNFEETGLFYCPFCSYTRAFDAYRKVKKIFSRARKVLSTFIGKDLTYGRQKKRPPARVSVAASQAEFIVQKSPDCNLHPNQYEKNMRNSKELPKQAECVSMCGKDKPSTSNAEILSDGRRDDTSQSAGRINDKGIAKEQDCQKNVTNNILNHDTLPCNGMGSSPIFENPDANFIDRQNEIGRGCECVGLVAEHQESAEPLALSDDGNLPCNKEDSSQIGNACDVTNATGEGENLAGKGPLHMEKPINQEQEQSAMVQETIIFSDHDATTSQIHERHSKRRQKEGERRSKRRRKEATIERTQLTEGTVVNQNKEKSSSEKHSKRKIQSKRYTNPMIPYGRRNKLLWTPEEEETLKIAVQKFATNTDGIYPWTKILEFGRHVFHKTRQPGDLKDKWRNIKIKEGFKTG